MTRLKDGVIPTSVTSVASVNASKRGSCAHAPATALPHCAPAVGSCGEVAHSATVGILVGLVGGELSFNIHNLDCKGIEMGPQVSQEIDAGIYCSIMEVCNQEHREGDMNVIQTGSTYFQRRRRWYADRVVMDPKTKEVRILS